MIQSIPTITSQDQKIFLTLDQASKYTNFAKSTLYKLSSKRKIPHYKPNGKKLFFLKSDLDAFVLSGRVPTLEETDKSAIEMTASPRLGHKRFFR